MLGINATDYYDDDFFYYYTANSSMGNSYEIKLWAFITTFKRSKRINIH